MKIQEYGLVVSGFAVIPNKGTKYGRYFWCKDLREISNHKFSYRIHSSFSLYQHGNKILGMTWHKGYIEVRLLGRKHCILNYKEYAFSGNAPPPVFLPIVLNSIVKIIETRTLHVFEMKRICNLMSDLIQKLSRTTSC